MTANYEPLLLNPGRILRRTNGVAGAYDDGDFTEKRRSATHSPPRSVGRCPQVKARPTLSSKASRVTSSATPSLRQRRRDTTRLDRIFEPRPSMAHTLPNADNELRRLAHVSW